MRPHRQQPTRLPCPWDPPGKNTGVGCHFLLQCMKVKSECEVAQSCLTLRDPMDCSLPDSSIHGIFQARVLEWGAISFSNAWKWKVKVKSISLVQFLAIPWTAAYQTPLSLGFSRQEYWSGVPLPSPGDLSNPWVEPESPASLALACRFFTTVPPGKPIYICICTYGDIYIYVYTHTHTYV